MLSFTDRFFPRFSLDTKNLALLYLSTAGFMILFDFGSGVVSSQGLPDSKFLVALFLLALTLPLCAIHPPLFELLYITIFLTSAYIGLQQSLTSPVVGAYVLVGVWLVRSWIIPGLLLLVLTEASLVVVSPYPGLQAIGALFGSGITIALSLAIRYLRLKTAKANTLAEHNRKQAEQARLEAEQARREARHASSLVRKQLAAQLHDTIAKDLVHLAIDAQQLSLQGTASATELTALAERAIATSKRIKPTILQLDTESGRANITETVSLVTKMLSTRNITLQNDVSENLDPQVTRQQALLACLVIREAATNILKYAPTDTTASLEVTREPDGAITITTSNTIGDSPANIGTTGGFGLANLEHQITLHGGELEYSHTPARWILWATIPTGGKE
ncbi:Signal transduction histidine kinase [Mobiluncus mulieris]|uniref:Signal transduction histidine kinase n=2 Tax=Mobiluncus mulieris TaxID=2052 RepID=A0A8G2HTQ3_9ACTO|nr:ATP-binding protein [Mobiluncus mulieris]STO16080.1 Signal transduction histidine kinase [Mobiluncus mulieris]